MLGGYIMEIGVPAILILISLGVCFAETKLGQKLTYFFAKKFCDIDINEWEEE
jgi:hypothetical protein